MNRRCPGIKRRFRKPKHTKENIKMDSNSKSEETDRQNVGLNVLQRKKNTMSYKPHGPRKRNMTSEDFDQFLSVYEFFGFFVPFQEKNVLYFINT